MKVFGCQTKNHNKNGGAREVFRSFPVLITFSQFYLIVSQCGCKLFIPFVVLKWKRKNMCATSEGGVNEREMMQTVAIASSASLCMRQSVCDVYEVCGADVVLWLCSCAVGFLLLRSEHMQRIPRKCAQYCRNAGIICTMFAHTTFLQRHKFYCDAISINISANFYIGEIQVDRNHFKARASTKAAKIALWFGRGRFMTNALDLFGHVKTMTYTTFRCNNSARTAAHFVCNYIAGSKMLRGSHGIALL